MKELANNIRCKVKAFRHHCRVVQLCSISLKPRIDFELTTCFRNPLQKMTHYFCLGVSETPAVKHGWI